MRLKNLSMNLSVSNLAWDSDENRQIFKKLNEVGIGQVEVALTKISSWGDLTDEVLFTYKNLLLENSLSIKSLQSIFYNTGITSLEESDSFLSHIKKLIHVSKILGVNVLVFGSPSLRKKFKNHNQIIDELFLKIDEYLNDTGIEFSIEPNSKIYGGEYFFTVDEIVEFIRKNKFNNIKTMIDTHNILLESQDPVEVLNTYYEHINHIHISEKELKPFTLNDFHITFAKVIKDKNYDRTLTYEVLKHDDFINSLSKFSLNYK